MVELFIFKFLSELKVLKSTYDFNSLMGMCDNNNSNREILKHYAKTQEIE